MNFKLKLNRRNIPEEELIADLKRVQEKLNCSLTKVLYDKHGKFSSGTYERRFDTWSSALKKAQLKVNSPKNLTDKDLFINLEEIWIKLGRQPKYNEIKKPLSKYSIGPYHTRFGQWNQALRAFIDWIQDENELDNLESLNQPSIDKNRSVHKTKREISDRLRFRILMRDGFTCRSCGRSPVKERDVELHVDHILPWSKGGETVPDNLETKCKKCNLGKGNAFDK